MKGKKKREVDVDEKLEKKKKGWKRRRRRREKTEEEMKKRGGRRIRNRESIARDAPPSPGAFPSQRLGNNMTPIKGRLGKNTTPTLKGKDPQKLIQELQRNPSKASRTSNIHPMRTSFTHHERQNLQKRRTPKQQSYHL